MNWEKGFIYFVMYVMFGYLKFIRFIYENIRFIRGVQFMYLGGIFMYRELNFG